MGKEKSIQDIVSSPDSLIAWFEAGLQQSFRNGKPKAKAVLAEISHTNALLLPTLSGNAGDPQTYMESVFMLWEHIKGSYLDDKKLRKAVKENWGEGGPLIQRIADTYADQLKASAQAKAVEVALAKKYGAKAVERAEELAQYVWDIENAMRRLTVQIYGAQPKSLFLSSVMPSEFVETCRKSLLSTCYEAALKGGSIVFRYQKGNSRKSHINGFLWQCGELHTVTPERLKYAMELQPDGSRVPDDTEIYEEAKPFRARRNI